MKITIELDIPDCPLENPTGHKITEDQFRNYLVGAINIVSQNGDFYVPFTQMMQHQVKICPINIVYDYE